MSTYNISKSSLLSLKAEINRKQEELHKAKLQNEVKKAQLKKPLEIKNRDVEQRKEKDGNDEDVDLLEKSRSVLESKARLYEKLSKQSNFTDDEIEHNRRFLVRFDAKNAKYSNFAAEDSDHEMDFNRHPSDEEEQHLSDEYEPAKNPDEEWVEYIDCLGRTRKCMRKDLEFLKSKDADLRVTLDKSENKDNSSNKEEKNVENQETSENEYSEKSEMLSNDMRRELLRQEWEKEEEELTKKSNIHYQDILFNEARMHGVGYYAFSKDEEERAKQQDALKNLRDETEQKQKKSEELRSLREKQLAARAKAARNRKRARMGLPPEEDEPEIVQQVEEEKKDEEKGKQNVFEEKKEQEREAARKRHIRPWDIGKEGIKEHYEYTQEEWNEKKRKERPTEFAPPTSYRRSFRGELEEKCNNESESNKTLFFSSKKQKRKDGTNNLHKKVDDTFHVDTSKPPPIIHKHHINPYKTKETVDYEQPRTVTSEPTPIVNECEDFDDEQDRLFNDFKEIQNSSNRNAHSSESDLEDDSCRGKGIEIAPPPTFDYYGPTGVKKSKPSNTKGNLENSIAAGLKFLRKQAEKKNTSSKHPSEMFIS